MIAIKTPDIESALRLLADYEQFSGDSTADGELSFDELEWVSAAASRPDRKNFQILLRQRKEK